MTNFKELWDNPDFIDDTTKARIDANIKKEKIMDYKLDKVIIVKFYEDTKNEYDEVLWIAGKEYEVECTFNDAFIVKSELGKDVNYGVSPIEAGTKFDIYRRV